VTGPALGSRRQFLRWATVPAALLGGASLGLPACGTTVPARIGKPGPGQRPLLAVFPMENLSPGRAPLADIRQIFVERLRIGGQGTLDVLDDAALERVVVKHRVRYTAGLAQDFAKALREEAGVEAVVIPSLELYDEVIPFRAALFARLVSTGDTPVIRRIDGVGMAGDDAPGLLGIGLVLTPAALLGRAVDALAAALVRRVSEGSHRPVAARYRPKIVYRSDTLDPDRTYSVAVMPFFNRSARKYAGELIGLHMTASLMAFPNLEVVEPGIVREELLRFRIIMSDGVSLPETETILNAVNADLVLNGEVLEYRDALGLTGAPKVDFGLLFIERRSRRVVYSSYSDNTGSDGVFFFDWRRVNTAHALAARMTRGVAERMLLGQPAAKPSLGSAAPDGRDRPPQGRPGEGKEQR
jgi:hypothetical protein